MDVETIGIMSLDDMVSAAIGKTLTATTDGGMVVLSKPQADEHRSVDIRLGPGFPVVSLRNASTE